MLSSIFKELEHSKYRNIVRLRILKRKFGKNSFKFLFESGALSAVIQYDLYLTITEEKIIPILFLSKPPKNNHILMEVNDSAKTWCLTIKDENKEITTTIDSLFYIVCQRRNEFIKDFFVYNGSNNYIDDYILDFDKLIIIIPPGIKTIQNRNDTSNLIISKRSFNKFKLNYKPVNYPNFRINKTKEFCQRKYKEVKINF